MADKPTETQGAGWLAMFGILGLFFVLWVIGGGYKNESAKNPFIPYPSVGNGTESLDNSSGNSQSSNNSTAVSNPSNSSSTVTNSTYSPWHEKITISTGNARSENNADNEFIRLSFRDQKKEKVSITGWTLRNNAGERLSSLGSNTFKINSEAVFIPTAAHLLQNGGTNRQEPLVFETGQEILIYSGKSPNKYPTIINSSFLTNSCFGYLSQNSSYTNIPYGSCPDLTSETGVNSLDDTCYSFIRRMSCDETALDKPEVDQLHLSSACRDFITSHYTYSACVANHIGDPDFYGKAWYVYLGRNQELWNNSQETITLLDADGKIVDSVEWGR